LLNKKKGINIDIIKAEFKMQEDWLLKFFANKKIYSLIVKAYSEAYGLYFILDKNRLQDMLAYPSEYDFGLTIRRHSTYLDDKTVKAINSSAALTNGKFTILKAWVLEDLEDGDGGCFCSGFDINLHSLSEHPV
jgi:hypothetical protein